ncbi:MAG TPA: hypothetical protein VMW16_16720 [Sedimentisphaerales bacterium]|nr:hypothetical protein [Sedimentisphaerales bacterium]
MYTNSRNRINNGLVRNKHLAPCFCAFALALLCFCTCCHAQEPPDFEQLSSSSVGQVFYELAYELAASQDVTGPQLEQAIALLTSAIKLDVRAKYVLPEMIRLAARHPDHDYSELMRQLLATYVNESADLEVARKAVWYLLQRANSREEREKLIEEFLNSLGAKNSLLGSELAAELGLLKAEKADLKAAQSYFLYAYNRNEYNRLAFAKLVELVGKQIPPVAYVEHFRLALGQNPLDIEAALSLARYAEALQLYDVAADAYEYAANLSRFLNPSAALPASIYIPWAISCYNTQRNQYRCLQIASEQRQTGRFDLFLEAIAGRAAAKVGDKEQADQILKAAAEKARELLEETRADRRQAAADKYSRKVTAEQLAWFYCFASPDVNEALEWANKAYAKEPNSPTAAAILAYSLVMNGQTDWAKLLVDNYQRTQIADLTLAQIYLAGQQKSPAVEALKSAIARDPGSLEAERAKEILARQEEHYLPPIDPSVLLTTLRNRFGQSIVPAFLRPAQIISVQLKLRGDKFSYGSKFDGMAAITNNSSEPLVISDDGLFKGNIRVDAAVSGDLEQNIQNLASVKIRPSSPVKPGQSFFVPLPLVTGRLRQMLFNYPQASLDIEFTVFIDPVITAEGKTINRLFDVEPAKAVVKRPGVELTGRYLQNRLDSLFKGQQGQKIRAAQLFIGLLMEQYAMAGREPLYKFTHGDWMPDLLKSALVRSLADDDWVVKVHTMAGMLSFPLDYELTDVISKNLNDSNWPCRLMAVLVLARSQGGGFGKVVEWTAKYDTSEYVRQMAIALGRTAAAPAAQEPATGAKQGAEAKTGPNR